MWTPERIAHLAVCVFEKFGSRSVRRVLGGIGKATDVMTASPIELMQTGISETAAVAFANFRKSFEADKFLASLDKEDIKVIFPTDPTYPALLLNGADRPEILFVRGTIPTEPMVAIVGSRKMTEYGKHCTDEISKDLSQASIAIVSGLALGIDGQAHQACLNADGKTIAVIATGLDDETLYPRAHVGLAQRILEQGGGLISEVPPKSPPRKERFPMRNRIIASMSMATVVVEGSMKSGSLITAQYALEEGREVLAVPGPIWSDQSQGTNQLIKAGAKPCLGAQDVLEALRIDRPELVSAARSAFPLEPNERALLDALANPTPFDELVEELALPPARVQSSLSMLEIKGFAKPLAGQIWIRT